MVYRAENEQWEIVSWSVNALEYVGLVYLHRYLYLLSVRPLIAAVEASDGEMMSHNDRDPRVCNHQRAFTRTCHLKIAAAHSSVRFHHSSFIAAPASTACSVLICIRQHREVALRPFESRAQPAVSTKQFVCRRTKK